MPLEITKKNHKVKLVLSLEVGRDWLEEGDISTLIATLNQELTESILQNLLQGAQKIG